MFEASKKLQQIFPTFFELFFLQKKTYKKKLHRKYRILHQFVHDIEREITLDCKSNFKN